MVALRYLKEKDCLVGLIFPGFKRAETNKLFNIVRLDEFFINENTYLHTMPRKPHVNSLEYKIFMSARDFELKRNGIDYKSNKKRYLAIKNDCARTFNGMWKKILENANQEALALARKFPLQYRAGIYRNSIKSEWFKQMVLISPIAVVRALNNPTALDLISNGAKLKEIHKELNIPLCLKKIKPGSTGAIKFAGEIEAIALNYPEIFNSFMPQQTIYQIRWLTGIRRAADTANEQNIKWIAKHCNIKMNNRPLSDTCIDIFDWQRNTETKLNCSWRNALLRSHEWHNQKIQELHYKKNIEDLKPLAEPWINGGKINDYEIVPIVTRKDLREEGRIMHHCVSSYDYYIENNINSIYSIRKNEERIATLSLAKIDELGGIKIQQIRGKYNQSVESNIITSVNRWIRNSFIQGKYENNDENNTTR